MAKSSNAATSSNSGAATSSDSGAATVFPVEEDTGKGDYVKSFGKECGEMAKSSNAATSSSSDSSAAPCSDFDAATGFPVEENTGKGDDVKSFGKECGSLGMKPKAGNLGMKSDSTPITKKPVSEKKVLTSSHLNGKNGLGPMRSLNMDGVKTDVNAGRGKGYPSQVGLGNRLRAKGLICSIRSRKDLMHRNEEATRPVLETPAMKSSDLLRRSTRHKFQNNLFSRTQTEGIGRNNAQATPTVQESKTPTVQGKNLKLPKTAPLSRKLPASPSTRNHKLPAPPRGTVKRINPPRKASQSSVTAEKPRRSAAQKAVADLRASAPCNPRGKFRLWTPNRIYAGIVPNRETKNLAECLGGATFFWPLERPEYAPAIQDQRGSDTCYIYATLSGIDYAAFLTKGWRDTVGSDQEIRDRLQHLSPHTTGIPFDPVAGYPNSPEAALWYLKNWANFPKKIYPSLPNNVTAKLKDSKVISPPGSKIIIEGYPWYSFVTNRRQRTLTLQVYKYPVIATIAVVESRFDQWDGLDVYHESKCTRNYVESFVKNLKNPDKKKSKKNLKEEVLMHAVLIVGWGYTVEGKLVYLFQNSWGDNWGYFGFGIIAADCVVEFGWPSDVNFINKVTRDNWAKFKAEKLAREEK